MRCLQHGQLCHVRTYAAARLFALFSRKYTATGKHFPPQYALLFR
ncbi:hypothetical protein HMPREF1148_1021 [Selenomonas sp. FOBRC6]|nr:hypothetical protein HMPREF1148_1021 [Selenomonas sp. FOBRC6]